MTARPPELSEGSRPVSRPRKALARFFSCRTRASLRRLRDVGEEGFTLIELVIALVILPLIMGAIAVAIFVTLQDQSGISTKISDSVDSQVTSTYFVRDVESALYVTTNGAPPSTPWQSSAGPGVCGSGTSLLVSFAWPSTTDIVRDATVISYWRTQLASGTGTTSGSTLTATSAIFSPTEVGMAVAQAQTPASRTITATVIPAGTTIRSVSATRKTVTLSKPVTSKGGVKFVVEPELTRDLCKTLPTPSTPSNVRTQAVSSTTSGDFLSPFTSAALSCVPAHTTCATAAQAGWIQATWVQAVTLAITQPSGKYDYNLTGSPRVTNTAGGLGSSSFKCPTGTCSLPTLLALGGTGVITETSCGQGGSSITVIGDAVLNTGYFVIHNCATFSAKKIVATKTPCHTYAKATCPTNPTQIKPRPPWTVPHAPVPDPLTFLTDPPAEPVQPCPTGSATLVPGQYEHCAGPTGTGAVSISGSGQVLKLEPGVYEFDTGVDVGGNGTLEMATSTPGTGVLVYLPCNTKRNGNHVDSWATQCAESFTVKNGTVDLRSTLTTEYAGLWYWQNKGDTQTMTATGQGSLVVTGILYAPGATVTVQGDQVKNTTPIGAIAAARFRVVHSHIVITGF